jgi:hypothetical protein
MHECGHFVGHKIILERKVRMYNKRGTYIDLVL